MNDVRNIVCLNLSFSTLPRACGHNLRMAPMNIGTIYLTENNLCMQEATEAKDVDKEGSRTLHFFDDDEDK